MSDRAKKLASVILALLLAIGLLAGCSDGQQSVTPTTSPEQTEKPTAQPSAEPSSAEEGYVYRMPIVDEPVTITKWQLFESTQISDPNEIKSNIELEKRTNVHVEHKLSTVADMATSFNLMVTSGDYTDLIYGGSYSGGDDKAIEDGVYLELSEMIEKWMPNVKRLMNADDDVRRLFYTDSGNISTICLITKGDPQYPFMGPVIRMDLLEKVGISKVPETYSELYDALKLFKTELGVEIPLAINYSGFHNFIHGFTAGYHIGPGFYNENGIVKFGFIEDGFLDYLTMMHNWYSEGLVDPDFYTKAGEFMVNMGDMASGRIATAETAFYTLIDMYAMLSGDPNYRVVGLPLPKQNANDALHFRIVGAKATAGTAVSSAADSAEKLEIIARWLDYGYTEEGYLLHNYGIEGETYNLVDGKPVYTDLILANPDGLDAGTAMNVYTGALHHSSWYEPSRERQIVSENAWNATVVWNDSSLGDWVMPAIAMTTEEGAEYSSIYADIDTYITETVPSFITGAKPLSEFPDFVTQIKSMGIDRCIEIQQAALDRFLAR